MPHKIAVLAGDGIGTEIMPEAIKVLNLIAQKTNAEFEFTDALIGGAAIDAAGKALPEETLKICESSDAILFGAVGGPKWETLPPEEQPERAALLPLRKHFDLFANLRPAIIFKPLKDASTLKSETIGDGLDILVFRELTSGIYFGEKGKGDDWASDEMKYTVKEIERIARAAFKAAQKRRKKLTSIDKANVLTTMVLWREVVTRVGKEFPDVELNHMYVDNAAMQLVRNPQQFDVMLCGNMFGDILSDEASMITGSIGLLASASVNEKRFGMYEPVHGSAPDIAGQGIANPIAQILSAGMMLQHTFGMNKEAEAIQKAVEAVLEKGYRTGDIMQEGMQKVGTKEMGDLILKELDFFL